MSSKQIQCDSTQEHEQLPKLPLPGMSSGTASWTGLAPGSSMNGTTAASAPGPIQGAPSYLAMPTPHSALSLFEERVNAYFHEQWPGLHPATHPKAASFFTANKIPMYTALMFPDAAIEAEKLPLAAEIIALVVLLDDYIDDLSGHDAKLFMGRWTSAWQGVFETEQAVEAKQDSPSATDTANGSVKTPKPQQIINMHVSLWQRLLASSPIFGRALGKAHLAQFEASFSDQRGKHDRIDKYLAFRRVEGGWHLAQNIQYWLVEAELLAGMSIETDQPNASTLNGAVGIEPMSHGTSTEVLTILHACEVIAAKHHAIVNDVISYTREAKASAASPAPARQEDHSSLVLALSDQPNNTQDNPHAVPLVSAVPLVMHEYGLGVLGAKNILWRAVRECERCFKMKRDEALALIASKGEERNGEDAKGESEDEQLLREMERVLLGMEAKMAGNEKWHVETGRYVV